MKVLNQFSKTDQKSISKVVSQSVPWLMVAAVIFVAINQRAAITSVGPLVGLIRDHLNMSNAVAGMISTIPLLAFAFFSPFAPKLGRKFGIEVVLLAALVVLTIGIILRSLAGVAYLFVGTSIIGIAIAVLNVLLPSLIKQQFPNRIGTMTGVYTISSNLMGAIASGISIPIAIGLGYGWQGALGLWGILSFISILVWLPQMKRRSGRKSDREEVNDNQQVNMWRSPLAWQVTLFMGLQSMIFYVLITWLPEILKSQGIGSDQSGWVLSILQLSLLPFTFIIPVISERMSNQRLLVVTMFMLFLMGTLGLLYGSSNLIVLWIMLIGSGGGIAFGLAMMFFSLRTENAHEAAELSGMAQSVGYLLAATGPLFFGFLHDVTNSWTTPLFILVGSTVLLFIFGLGAASNRYISSYNGNHRA